MWGEFGHWDQPVFGDIKKEGPDYLPQFVGWNFALSLAVAILFLTTGYRGDQGHTDNFADKIAIMISPYKCQGQMYFVQMFFVLNALDESVINALREKCLDTQGNMFLAQ